MAYKIIVNSTDLSLDVTLYVRAGAEPGRILEEKQITLASGANGRVEYGNSANPYLNGIAISYVNTKAGNRVTQNRQVVQRGNGWDNRLNTKDTVTIVDHKSFAAS